MEGVRDSNVLRDYTIPTIDRINSSILKPNVECGFEIQIGLIQLIQKSIQFGGLPNKDPYEHIAEFLEICDTFKYEGVSDDGIRLRLFSFSLKDKAKVWLRSLPSGTITTWDDLAKIFLAKYFSLARTAKLRSEIFAFA